MKTDPKKNIHKKVGETIPSGCSMSTIWYRQYA